MLRYEYDLQMEFYTKRYHEIVQQLQSINSRDWRGYNAGTCWLASCHQLPISAQDVFLASNIHRVMVRVRTCCDGWSFEATRYPPGSLRWAAAEVLGLPLTKRVDIYSMADFNVLLAEL